MDSVPYQTINRFQAAKASAVILLFTRPLVLLQDDVVAKPSIDLNIPEHNLSETVFSLNQKQEIPIKTSRNHPCS